jgi:hypothetical protein
MQVIPQQIVVVRVILIDKLFLNLLKVADELVGLTQIDDCRFHKIIEQYRVVQEAQVIGAFSEKPIGEQDQFAIGIARLIEALHLFFIYKEQGILLNGNRIEVDMMGVGTVQKPEYVIEVCPVGMRYILPVPGIQGC